MKCRIVENVRRHFEYMHVYQSNRRATPKNRKEMKQWLINPIHTSKNTQKEPNTLFFMVLLLLLLCFFDVRFEIMIINIDWILKTVPFIDDFFFIASIAKNRLAKPFFNSKIERLWLFMSISIDICNSVNLTLAHSMLHEMYIAEMFSIQIFRLFFRREIVIATRGGENTSSQSIVTECALNTELNQYFLIATCQSTQIYILSEHRNISKYSMRCITGAIPAPNAKLTAFEWAKKNIIHND